MSNIFSPETSNSTYDFSSLNSSLLHRVIKAETLEAATKIESLVDLLRHIVDWFRGGVQRQAAENLFTLISDINQNKAYSDIDRIDNFVALKELALPEYQDNFTLEIKNNRFGEDMWEYQLCIDGRTIYRSEIFKYEERLLDQLRTYGQDGRIKWGNKGEITRLITGKVAEDFESFLQCRLPDTDSTSKPMPRDDGKFAPSNQFSLDVFRSQTLSSVKGKSENGYINFSQSPLNPYARAEKTRMVEYMDKWLDQLTQVTGSEATTFALTRHLHQGVAASLLRLQLAHPSILAPWPGDITISPSPWLDFGVEKQANGSFNVTVKIAKDAIEEINLTNPGLADDVNRQITMEPSCSYFHGQFVMNISADGKEITRVVEPLSLRYQLVTAAAHLPYSDFHQRVKEEGPSVVLPAHRQVLDLF